MSKLYNLYRPYLPAITIFIGAVMVAFGMFLEHTRPEIKWYQWLRLIGSIMAAIGALWAGHNQIKSSSENRKLNNKIADLVEQTIHNITGGEAFCYGYPIFGVPTIEQSQWLFIHVGENVLHDVSVRICNLSHRNIQTNLPIEQTVHLGTLFPGRAHTFMTCSP